MTKYIDTLRKIGENKEVVKVLVVSAKEVADMETEMILDAPYTQGTTIVKAIVADGGMLTLKGMIKIKKKGRNANAFLRQNVLLLGKTAKAVVTPDLEIENDEVKASHAATVGKMDENELFYLMSKGFLRKEAERMIAQAFVEELKEKISKDEWLLVEKKIKELV